MDRHIEVLSDLELGVYLNLQLLTPRDVREQFCLQPSSVELEFFGNFPEAEGSVAVAKRLRLKHPMFSLLEAKLMSTDFLVTLRTHEKVAIHVKYEKDLTPPRAIELRRIEEEYWRQRGVGYEILTEKHVNRKQLTNLHMLNSFNRKNTTTITALWLKQLVILAKYEPMQTVIARMSMEMEIDPIVLVDRVKFSVATGLVRLELKTARLNWSEIWPHMSLAEWAESEVLAMGSNK